MVKSVLTSGPYLLSAVVVLFVLIISGTGLAADDIRKQAETTIRASLDDLWAGRAFSPALEKQQQALRDRLEKGSVSQAALENIIEEMVFSIMERETTTRSIIQAMPARISTLLSPYMEWAEVKKRILETGAAVIDESLEALWADREFPPELKAQQQALRNFLEATEVARADLEGIITRAELEDMVAQATLSIMEKKRTTRYIIQKMPERIIELLSPHMEWDEVRELLWKAGSAVVGDGQQAVISVGTLAPAGTPWLTVPEGLIGEIERLTDKKFTIRIFPGGVMGEDTDILRKMDVGQLDACGCTALGILSSSPETMVFLLPGLFKNYDEVDHIFKKFRQRIDSAFEERGYILASLIDTGYFHVFSKNRISSLADIRRSKMLTWFGTLETTLFDELGISAMPVSVTETISAFSTGMADTNLAPSAWMLGMQAYQYVNYFLAEPWLYSPGAAIVSTRTRARLQKQFGLSDTFAHNVQEMLIFEFSSLESEWKRQARSYEARCFEAFVKRVGMTAVTLPPADKKFIEQAGRNVWKRLAGRFYPKDLLNDILIALDEYRQQ